MGPPDQGKLRRAVSTAYYALFHKIIERSADQIVGVTAAVPLRSLISRAFGHGTMKELAERLGRNQAPKNLQALIQTVPRDLADVANAFVELQAERHRADYDLARPFRKAEVVQLLQLAEHAIGILDGQLSTELRHFLIVLPMWSQLKSR
jgi:hypothetical protein